MNIQLKPISDPKKLQDHMNSVQMIEAIRNLEAQVQELQDWKNEVTSGRLTLRVPGEKPRVHTHYSPYIMDILNDGKIWAVQAIAEEIRKAHPEFPEFKDQGVYNTCLRLATIGKIEKLAANVYRKKQEV